MHKNKFAKIKIELIPNCINIFQAILHVKLFGLSLEPIISYTTCSSRYCIQILPDIPESAAH